MSRWVKKCGCVWYQWQTEEYMAVLTFFCSFIWDRQFELQCQYRSSQGGITVWDKLEWGGQELLQWFLSDLFLSPLCLEACFLLSVICSSSCWYLERFLFGLCRSGRCLYSLSCNHGSLGSLEGFHRLSKAFLQEKLLFNSFCCGLSFFLKMGLSLWFFAISSDPNKLTH